MKKMKHSLFLAALLVLCGQFFPSCSSSKMTQAEVAEYYKDLKITGKGTGSYSAKTERISPTKQHETTATAQNQVIENLSTKSTPIEAINTSTFASKKVETPALTATTDEIILASDSPVVDLQKNTETEVYISPAMKQAKEKMEILANNSSLSKKEKRAMKKEVRKTVMQELKAQKKANKIAKKNGQEVADSEKFVRIVFAFLLPPLSVALGRGIGSTFWLNLLLSLIFLLPGIIHALIVIGEDY